KACGRGYREHARHHRDARRSRLVVVLRAPARPGSLAGGRGEPGPCALGRRAVGVIASTLAITATLGGVGWSWSSAPLPGQDRWQEVGENLVLVRSEGVRSG